jgi:rhodanese-related sulfurtransferase
VAGIVASVTREELLAKLERGEDFVLVDALAPIAYARSRLPGAINLPPDWVAERAPRRIPDRAKEVVVYCSDADCESSVVVANRLLELGYERVGHYAGGKRDWVEAGLPLEGSGA